jgi:hypothetical protein
MNKRGVLLATRTDQTQVLEAGIPAAPIARRLARRVLQSTEAKLFLAGIVVYLLVQLALNTILPFPNYSEHSGHDGSVYYAIAADPLPDTPLFTFKRYQRPLLPLLVWAFFAWDRMLGLSVVNAVAASIAVVYFYKIVRERQAATALRLTLLFAATPYLFASAHLGLTEPLMMAGLLSGYYYARKGEPWKATLGYALALLAKEIALFPILAEVALRLRRGDVRGALRMAASFTPMAIWYLLLGLRWGQPLWMLHGTDGQLGFGPSTMLALLTHPPAAQWYLAAFISLNQVANGLMLAAIVAGLYRLRGDRPAMYWVTFSATPLVFLGEAIYTHNFDLGRQALPAALLLVALGSSRVIRRRRYYWPTLVALVGCSLLWTLYFARFLVYY